MNFEPLEFKKQKIQQSWYLRVFFGLDKFVVVLVFSKRLVPESSWKHQFSFLLITLSYFAIFAIWWLFFSSYRVQVFFLLEILSAKYKLLKLPTAGEVEFLEKIFLRKHKFLTSLYTMLRWHVSNLDCKAQKEVATTVIITTRLTECTETSYDWSIRAQPGNNKSKQTVA